MDVLTLREKQRLLSWARESRTTYSEVSAAWAERRHHSRGALDYLSEPGGFRLTHSELSLLPPKAADWWWLNAKHEHDGLLTRGFGYYAVDASMYIKDRLPSARARHRYLTDRLRSYASLASMFTPSSPPRDWFVPILISVLGLMDWIYNDLSTAKLFAAGPDQDFSSTQCRSIDNHLATAAQLIVDFGLFAFCAGDAVTIDRQIVDRLESLCWAVSENLAPELEILAGEVDERPLRAVREGDEIWRVICATEVSVQSILDRHSRAKVVLVEEAFGAVGIGHLVRALLRDEDQGRCDIRTVRHSIHEPSMGRAIGGTDSLIIVEPGVVVVHLDDSTFSGRTHWKFRETVTGNPAAIYLASLSIDVCTPFIHPEELLWRRGTIAAALDDVEEYVRAPSGRMPAAISRWVRRKPASVPRNDFDRVVRGSDRLLGALWHRFADEIGGTRVR